jgi:sigma-E factor negative regulatory protein RseB
VRRSLGLLVSAVVTVTIPGVLAVLAILGHEHALAGTGAVSATALADESAVGPLPVAPAGTNLPVRNSMAGVQRTSGSPVTVFSDVAASQQAYAMGLLSQAAAAGQATTYQGVEVTSQSGVDGNVTVVSQVWHQGGGLTLIRTSSGATPVVSYGTGDRSPAGVFGVTGAQVALLGKHYVAAYRGAGTASGMPARIVDVYRFDGSLAARFWLDARTLVPLQREDFDPADKLVSDELFTQVRFGPLTERPTAAMAAAPASASASAPASSSATAWVGAGAPVTVVATLAKRGVRLPGTVLVGLPLYAAAWSGTGAGQVTDLEYSDGLSVISLFVQRGTLAASMTGWEPLRLDGIRVYVSGHSVTWAGRGEVYTMIADAPPQTVAEAVAALPGGGQPGLVDRLGRGFDRLAHLVDPFA